MAWYSILPSHLTTYETWIVRVFVLLAFINLLPWLLAILYDVVLYILRRAWHEVPIWGGRARGDQRPRAPSLRDRRRTLSFSLRDIVGGEAGSEDGSGQPRRRIPSHRKTLSGQSIAEETGTETDKEKEDGEDGSDA